MLTPWWWLGIWNYELNCENKIGWRIDIEECIRLVLWMEM
jgi:hypothetical protein